MTNSPALDPRLASARAKWERAKVHADQLVCEMKEASGGSGPRVSKTSRSFDSDTNEIVWIADEIVPELNPSWVLMIGDCVSNLRCALDHLWWALAVDHMGREPTEGEAKQIQFPILTNSTPEKFKSHRFLKHVSAEVAEKALEAQGFDRPKGSEPYLGVLAGISNHDKHRKIQPSFFRASNVGIQIGEVGCVDCEMPKSDIEGAEWSVTLGYPDLEAVELGDEMLRQEVIPTGPNPDLKVDPDVTLSIGFGPEEAVVSTLKHMGEVVYALIVEFSPLLKR